MLDERFLQRASLVDGAQGRLPVASACRGAGGKDAIDARKIGRELGWRPQESFTSGMRKTVRWYLERREKRAA